MAYEERPGDASTTQQAKEHARQQAQQAKGEARQRLREQVDQRSTQAGDRIGGAASDARSVADELRRQGKDTPARYAEQAAHRAERFGDYLREADGDAILRDAEDFARRNPWAVAAGGLALGFVASRLLKASSTERHRSSLTAENAHAYRREGAESARSDLAYGSSVSGSPPAVPTEPALSRMD